MRVEHGQRLVCTIQPKQCASAQERELRERRGIGVLDRVARVEA
jgi:hypothetical protein